MYQNIERGICVFHLNIECEWMVNGVVRCRWSWLYIKVDIFPSYCEHSSYKIFTLISQVCGYLIKAVRASRLQTNKVSIHLKLSWQSWSQQMQNCKQYNQSTWRGRAIYDTYCTILRWGAVIAFSFFWFTGRWFQGYLLTKQTVMLEKTTCLIKWS